MTVKMEFQLNSDSSDSDYENDQIELDPIIGRRQRTFRPRINFELHPTDAQSRFRLTNEHMAQVTERLQPLLQHETDCNYALSAEQQIRLAVRYLATGSNFSVVGDAHGVHKSTVSRALHRVVEAVNSTIYPEVVDWPRDQAQILRIAQDFYDKCGMPSVFGCIDGSHFEIIAPSKDEPQFVNRHGTHSLNGLLVSGPKLRFYYVLTKYPGCVHDARVFRVSTLKRRLDTGWRPLQFGVLLGDSAYRNCDYLVTPIDNPQSNQETRYNRAHRGTRVTVECAIGLLKQRFRCLLGKMHLPDPAFAAEVIRCCVALHNFLLSDDEAEEALDAFDFDDRFYRHDADPNLEREVEDLTRRQQLVNLF